MLVKSRIDSNTHLSTKEGIRRGVTGGDSLAFFLKMSCCCQEQKICKRKTRVSMPTRLKTSFALCFRTVHSLTASSSFSILFLFIFADCSLSSSLEELVDFEHHVLFT